MRKIGICFGAVRNMPKEDYVKLISELGFSATFTGIYATEAEQAAHAELFAKYGIAYENIHAPFGGINNIWLDNEDGVKMLDTLLMSVDRCKLVGASVLVVHLSSGLTPPSVTDMGQERFKRLMEHAEKQGITIAYENQRMLGNIAWAFEQFADSPSLGFCWDCGHENCFTIGRQYMPLFGKKLVCTHIHDNSGVFNADNHLLPFDGAFDFNRFARQIKESGYKGSLMLEVMKDHGKGFYDGVTEHEYMLKAADAIKKIRTMVDGE
ncbi:MAG: sugar phosphate isomerase/epimerase [Ruminococcaceae bacterium]|nr:sugar phosphate isomerase/epimerase [Oscillospiraceae bacterium]